MNAPKAPKAALNVAPDEVCALGALTDEALTRWQALIVEHGGGYFSGPVWCRAWYEHFGEAGETRVGIWRDGGSIVAVAAMICTRERLLPASARFSPRVSAWRNVGASEGSADHLSFAGPPDLRRSIIDWAFSLGPATRLLNLDPAWGGEAPAGRRFTRSDIRTYRVPISGGEPHPGSKKMWKNIAWGRRRLVDQGVSFGVHVGRDVDEPLLRDLVDLHAKRSSAAGRTTSFTIDRLPFHVRLARESNELHRSVMITAHQEGALIGGLYGFLDPTTFSYYQSGWSPEFERLSLGSVLLGDAFDAAGRLGSETFDFLRGDEPYKLRFGASIVHDISCAHLGGVGGVILGVRDQLVHRAAARRDVGTTI